MFVRRRVRALSAVSNTILAISCLGALGCGSATSNSQLRMTVDLEQTDVRSQGKFGVCWAYGTAALVESEAIREKKKKVDISEEAIVFYRLAEALQLMFKTMPVPDLISVVQSGKISEGWYTRIVPEMIAPLNLPSHVEVPRDALDIIKQYGAVPESAWSFKVTSFADRDALFRAISNNIMRLYQNEQYRNKSHKDFTLEEIMDLFLVGWNSPAFPSRPPTSFDVEVEKGVVKNMSAKSYVTDYLGFNPDAWGALAAFEEKDYEKIVTATKRALGLGHSVPLAFPISVARIKDAVFTGEGVTDLTKPREFSSDGGHLVLITDFVNQGGKEGELDAATLKREIEKPAKELDYFVLKNSWGVGALTNEQGVAVSQSEDGYYRMDKSYLLGAARVPDLLKPHVGEASKFGAMVVVVPVEIANELKK